MNVSFDVFLSHNSKDKPTVRQLAQALQARGLRVWLDEWELVPGRPSQKALKKIIQTTRTAAVLVGKDGLGPWEIKEMQACLSQSVKRDFPVIPVLLPDAPSKLELDLFLEARTWVDLRGGLTNEGLDRLQWGITGDKPGQLLRSAAERLSPFDHTPRDEGGGSDPWIVKTLDHLKQVRPLRDRLRASGGPAVAVVEGCSDDWPNYLADDVFLEPWPGLDDIPLEATTLNPTRYGESEDAFWSAVHHQRVPASRQATGQNQAREAVRAWLRERDRHLFFISCSMEDKHWGLRRLIRAAQDFLAELSRCEPGMRLLMLIVCQPSRDSPPWWWPLCRRYLKRIPGVLWLEPLRPLERPDVSTWHDGFSSDVMRLLNRDMLYDELLKLFNDGRTGIRYTHVRRRLLDGGALEKARTRR